MSRSLPSARLHIIGLRTFGESGTSEELYEKYGLSGSGITRTVKEALAPLG